jgi:hypothetical protein
MEEAKVCKELFNASLLLDNTSESLANGLEMVRATVEGESKCSLQAKEDGSFYCQRFVVPCPLRHIVEIR